MIAQSLLVNLPRLRTGGRSRAHLLELRGYADVGRHMPNARWPVVADGALCSGEPTAGWPATWFASSTRRPGQSAVGRGNLGIVVRGLYQHGGPGVIE
jgi:hypothetical protein